MPFYFIYEALDDNTSFIVSKKKTTIIKIDYAIFSKAFESFKLWRPQLCRHD